MRFLRCVIGGHVTTALLVVVESKTSERKLSSQVPIIVFFLCFFFRGLLFIGLKDLFVSQHITLQISPKPVLRIINALKPERAGEYCRRQIFKCIFLSAVVVWISVWWQPLSDTTLCRIKILTSTTASWFGVNYKVSDVTYGIKSRRIGSTSSGALWVALSADFTAPVNHTRLRQTGHVIDVLTRFSRQERGRDID